MVRRERRERGLLQVTRRLAVLGSPIAHSRSPQLHRAAAAALGLDWRSERIELRQGELDAFVTGLDRDWLGCSVTMPLKREAFLRADRRGPVAASTGLANTLRFDDDGVFAENTDVAGIVGALAAVGVTSARNSLIVGGGATARSALAALNSLGASVVVLARTPERVGADPRFAEATEPFELASLTELERRVREAELVVSTVPGGFAPTTLPSLAETQLLLDVVYEPWPTPFALAWRAAGGRLASGLEMLLEQGIAQTRIFVGGDADTALPDEDRIRAAMREALGEGIELDVVGGS